MKLFEFAPTRSIRARWTLQELGVAFEAVTVDLLAGEHRGAAFLKINPAGKIPALIDGDTVVTESVAIALYLAEKYPERALINALNSSDGSCSPRRSWSSRSGALRFTQRSIRKTGGWLAKWRLPAMILRPWHMCWRIT